MKLWCIIELSMLDDGFGSCPDPNSKTCYLDTRYSPTIFYTEKELAETEIFRLHKNKPHNEFVLFEAIGKIIQSQVNHKACYIEEPELV